MIMINDAMQYPKNLVLSHANILDKSSNFMNANYEHFRTFLL